MIRLNCQHADTCLSDYWGGHHLAHVSIPVHRGMTFKAIRDALHAELRQGAIAGSDDRTRDDSGAIGDAWFAAAHAAIERDVRPAQHGATRAFMELDPTPDDFDGEEVMAYFVFSDRDDSTAYFLREGSDALDKARPFPTLRAAVDAFATSARELARYGQAHEATVHVAARADQVDEYPDYMLTLGPRGGVRMEAA